MYLLLGGIAMAGILLIYFLLNLPVFKIESLEVIGLKKIAEEKILDGLKGSILENSFARILGLGHFLAWPGKIDIRNPLISEIRIKKDYLNKKIVIEVEEKKEYAIWCYIYSNKQNNCYWFDREGIILEKAPSAEGSLVFTINERSDREIYLGMPVMAERPWNNVKKILEIFENLPIKITAFELDQRLQELTADGSATARIVFSLRFPPSEKLSSYLKTISENGELAKAEYLDLTVENRIYLKNK